MFSRKFFSFAAAALSAVSAFALDMEQHRASGSVVLKTYSVTNNFVSTNRQDLLLSPVSISYQSAVGITNTFSVKHVRVDFQEQFATNNFLQPTNTVRFRTTNYWMLVDSERGFTGQSVTITNDASVVLEVAGYPFVGYLDEITFSHSASNVPVRTHVVYKGE